MPTFGRFREQHKSAVRVPATRRRFPMSRRPLVLLALSLVSLTLAACSDATGPTTTQRQLAPSAPSADLCVGGTLLSGGKC
jgi:hypothetical protein